MTIYFSELRSPQVAQAASEGALLVLPFGQTEEHGPHLPINTDALLARRVSEEAVRGLQGRPQAYVLDTICYGYSQKVLMQWPGTFILPQATVIDTLKSIIASAARMGFRKVAVVSMHGNHVGSSRVAAREVADECGIGPGIFFPYGVCAELIARKSKAGPRGSCHAGEFETSVMLHLAPELVDMRVATAGDKLTFESPFPSSQAFVSTWTLQKSKTGVYGDPTVATPEFGKLLFDTMVDATVRFLRYYHGVTQV
jgi:creatinine amidohydrolase